LLALITTAVLGGRDVLGKDVPQGHDGRAHVHSALEKGNEAQDDQYVGPGQQYGCGSVKSTAQDRLRTGQLEGLPDAVFRGN
jgi:hypothetical protein